MSEMEFAHEDLYIKIEDGNDSPALVVLPNGEEFEV